MKVLVKAEVSHTRTQHTFDLEDFNIIKEEWEQLPSDKKQAALQELIDECGDQPSWFVTNWEEA